jgi:hypothetical protein
MGQMAVAVAQAYNPSSLTGCWFVASLGKKTLPDPYLNKWLGVGSCAYRPSYMGKPEGNFKAFKSFRKGDKE